MTVLQQLAIKWTEREAALGYKGKRAEAAVFEFFIGASAALDLASHEETEHVRCCAALILAQAPFPLGVVHGWACGEGRAATATAGCSPWSVMLLPPDYVVAHCDTPTLHHVQASNPSDAFDAALAQASRDHGLEQRELLPSDWRLLLVTPGHIVNRIDG